MSTEKAAHVSFADCWRRRWCEREKGLHQEQGRWPVRVAGTQERK
jgi:hypothetical protein